MQQFPFYAYQKVKRNINEGRRQAMDKEEVTLKMPARHRKRQAKAYVVLP